MRRQDPQPRARRAAATLVSFLTVAAYFASAAPMAASDRVITVSGTGEVMARPTHVEIDLSASAAAELTADAIQKYRDSLRRTTEAFQKLDMKDLKIEKRELAFASSSAGGNPRMVVAVPGGGAGAAAKSQVDISRSLRLVLGGIDQLEETTLMETIGTLLDTARDSGATVGQSSSNALRMQMMGRQAGSSSMVTFVVDNAAEQHEKAYQQAFAEARSRATRLAKLAGATLGEVVSIEEAADTPRDDASLQEQMITAIYGIGSKSKSGARLTSDKYGDVPVRVTLRAKFELSSKRGKSSDKESDTK